MKNKVTQIQTISIKRDNSKAQISRYLLDNKNKLPQKIVLNWQNFEEIEGILETQIEGDLKRINSTIGKRKLTTLKLNSFLGLIVLLLYPGYFMLVFQFIIPSAKQCLEDILLCELEKELKKDYNHDFHLGI